jgi:hypothetical protein
VTFTLVSHESGIKTWCVLTTYPERVYCDDKIVSVWKVQFRMLNGSQHWRNNWQGKDCHTVENHYQHRVVLIQRVFWKFRQKSVLECRATKRLFVTTGNTDGKRPCLSNSQTVLMRTPTPTEFVECCSEAIIRNSLSPTLTDDPLFRKVLVTTSHMDQTTVYMVKGTDLEKRDTCHITIHS